MRMSLRLVAATALIPLAMGVAQAAPQRTAAAAPAPAPAAAPAPQAAPVDPSVTMVPLTDDVFIQQASVGGQAEITAAQLAESRSQNADVKAYARRMIEDHTRANARLAQITHQRPNTPVALDEVHALRLQQLQSLTPEAFDRIYLLNQETDHNQQVQLFAAEAQDGTTPALKTFAQQTLPTLKMHLDMAQKLSAAATADSSSK